MSDEQKMMDAGGVALRATILDWGAQEVGHVNLCEGIFGQSLRRDILQRVVTWQLAKRRSGNHKAKTRSEVSGTTRKPHKQKGTGRARQGSLRSPQFRKGGSVFGPVVRSHAFSLPKKVRRLGLRVALSYYFDRKKLSIIEAPVFQGSTRELDHFSAHVMGASLRPSLLIVADVGSLGALRKAAANLPHVDVLPVEGLNVYDILRHRGLVLTQPVLKMLEGRLL